MGGPTGPADKQLDRKMVWPENEFSGGQRIRTSLGFSLRDFFAGANCFGIGRKGGLGIKGGIGKKGGRAKVVRIRVSGEVVE